MIINPNDPQRPNGDSEEFTSPFVDNEMMGFKVKTKLWSQVKAIFAESGASPELLAQALKEGHGIDFDPLTENPMLNFIVSEEQLAILKRNGVPNPTFMQLLGTCEVIDKSQERAIQRFRQLKGDPRA